ISVPYNFSYSREVDRPVGFNRLNQSKQGLGSGGGHERAWFEVTAGECSALQRWVDRHGLCRCHVPLDGREAGKSDPAHEHGRVKIPGLIRCIDMGKFSPMNLDDLLVRYGPVRRYAVQDAYYQTVSAQTLC